MRIWQLIGFLWLLTTQIMAFQGYRNVVFVSIDGLSRETFYALLQKNKLPHIQDVIASGNYLNMTEAAPDRLESYFQLFSGHSIDEFRDVMGSQQLKKAKTVVLPNKMSFFEHLKLKRPEVSIGLCLSQFKGSEGPLTSILGSSRGAIDVMCEDKVRSSREIGQQVASDIRRLWPPFLMVFNFPNVDYVGSRYREGAQLYSRAAQNCDYSFGQVLRALKEKGVLEQTVFVLTTNYGYVRRLPRKSSNVWVASSQKMARKGTQTDLVKGLHELFGLELPFHLAMYGQSSPFFTR